MELHIYDDATGEMVFIPPEEHYTPRHYTLPGMPVQILAATSDDDQMAQSEPREDTDDMGASDGAGLGDYQVDCGGDVYEDGEDGSDDGFVEYQEVYMSDNCSEFHYVITHELGINKRKVRYGFIGLRMLRFSDGKEVLISFCRGTCPEPNLNDLMVQDCPYWPQPASSWGTTVTLCACGERMVRLLGGQASVERLMLPHSEYIAAVAAAAARNSAAAAPAVSSGNSEERVEVSLISGVTAVRLCARFNDWAVLNSKGRCQTCPPRRRCRHTSS